MQGACACGDCRVPEACKVDVPAGDGAGAGCSAEACGLPAQHGVAWYRWRGWLLGKCGGLRISVRILSRRRLLSASACAGVSHTPCLLLVELVQHREHHRVNCWSGRHLHTEETETGNNGSARNEMSQTTTYMVTPRLGKAGQSGCHRGCVGQNRLSPMVQTMRLSPL